MAWTASLRVLAAVMLMMALGTLRVAGTEEHHDHETHDIHDHAEDTHGHSHGMTQAEYDAALARGEDPCGPESLDDYHMGLHIASVFILLGVSLLGSLFPVALHVTSKSEAAMCVIRMGTYFGFGTILSTAFIHMLLPAAAALSSPCLPASFTETYEAWAYLFVTLAIMFMHLIDYLIKGFFSRLEPSGKYASGKQATAHEGGCHHTHHAAIMGAIMSHDLQPPLPSHPSPQQGGQQDVEGGDSNSEDGKCPVHGEGCNTLLKHKPDTSQIVGIYLTEAGIIFHSVMIGLTLGVASGAGFKTLLVAISLHQFFEGFAIGSAAVDSGIGTMGSTIMGLVYSVTTPIGIGVGIGVRASFRQNAVSTLLASGILDSLSTGILVYVVLVELLTPMFTDSPWLRSRRWWVQATAFVAFYSGAAAMAVIGKWV